jgi:hypothetical protein
MTDEVLLRCLVSPPTPLPPPRWNRERAGVNLAQPPVGVDSSSPPTPCHSALRGVLRPMMSPTTIPKAHENTIHAPQSSTCPPFGSRSCPLVRAQPAM